MFDARATVTANSAHAALSWRARCCPQGKATAALTQHAALLYMERPNTVVMQYMVLFSHRTVALPGQGQG